MLSDKVLKERAKDINEDKRNGLKFQGYEDGFVEAYKDAYNIRFPDPYEHLDRLKAELEDEYSDRGISTEQLMLSMVSPIFLLFGARSRINIKRDYKVGFREGYYAGYLFYLSYVRGYIVGAEEAKNAK